MPANMLPPTFQFLGLGWWVLHFFLIGFVYMLGFKAGKKKAFKLAAEGKAPGA